MFPSFPKATFLQTAFFGFLVINFFNNLGFLTSFTLATIIPSSPAAKIKIFPSWETLTTSNSALSNPKFVTEII